MAETTTLHLWKLGDGSSHWLAAPTAEDALRHGREKYGIGTDAEDDDLDDELAAALAEVFCAPEDVTCEMVPDDEMVGVAFPEGLDDRPLPEGATVQTVFETTHVLAAAAAWAATIGDGVYLAGSEW